MDKPNITIVSWNVNGLVGRNRKFPIHRWIKKLPSLPTILGLQEIKTSSFLTTVALNTILPDYPQIVFLPDEGRGGTTLLYNPWCTLIRFATLELSRTVWAQLGIGDNIVSIALIYAPSASHRERTFLWYQLKAFLPDGQWVLMGNFNMTEDPIDSSGPSPLRVGSQLETWRMLKTRFDLVDAFPITHSFRGTHSWQ